MIESVNAVQELRAETRGILEDYVRLVLIELPHHLWSKNKMWK